MIVTPIPIVALLFAVQAIVFSPLVVALAQPNAVGPTFPIIPTMIVAVVLVVIAHSRGATSSHQRSKHCGRKQKGPGKTVHAMHFTSLLRRDPQRVPGSNDAGVICGWKSALPGASALQIIKPLEPLQSCGQIRSLCVAGSGRLRGILRQSLFCGATLPGGFVLFVNLVRLGICRRV